MSWSGIVFGYLPGQSVAVPAGRLALLEDGLESMGSTFGYGRGYLARAGAIPVDPFSLPLSASPGDEKLYEPPEGLRLFGAVRDAAPDFWGRRVIESKLQVPPNSLPESRYLLEAGSQRFGALDFRATPLSPESAGVLPPATDLRYLVEAADRIQQGEPVPAQLQALFEVATLGGARPKALVRHKGRHYLAKFPRATDPFDVPVIEHACLELARQCGLEVPATDLVTLPDRRTVMLIERFDRSVHDDGSVSRRHSVSALTMLGKHEQDSPNSTYSEIAQAISTFGADGHVQRDRTELFGRVAFNILVSNNDDHLRNHAFVWEPTVKGWRLSPLYDVVATPQLATERTLHLSVGPRGRLARLDNLLEAHGAYGLLRHDAADVIARVASHVREWRTRFEGFGVSTQQCDRVQSAFMRPRDVGIDVIERALKPRS
jgi:serine/threonine-protein kinase HipA